MKRIGNCVASLIVAVAVTVCLRGVGVPAEAVEVVGMLAFVASMFVLRQDCI